MAEATPPVIRWTQLVAQSVQAVFEQQRYWWVIAVYAFLLASFELALDFFIDGRSVVASSMVIVLSTLLSIAAYFLHQAFWLYVLFFSVQRFDWGSYAVKLRCMIKPYALSALVVVAACVPLGVLGAALLFGAGERAGAHYLHGYRLSMMVVVFTVAYGLGMRLSFSYIGAMDDSTRALKTAWRRAQPYWWDMTVAAMVFVIPNIVFKLWWRDFAPGHFSLSIRAITPGFADGVLEAVIAAIQITAYRFAKAHNILKSGNENGAAA